MSTLYARLESIGIPRAFARASLPSWWDDEVSECASGLQQAQLYLARSFNLDIKTFDAPGAVQFRSAQRKYKLSKGVTEQAVLAGAQYVTAMAKLALAGYGKQQIPLPPDAFSLRNACLQYGDSVNLSTILSYCSSIGLPVIHIENLPGPKMYGLVVRDGGRYAIVISRKGYASEILFWIAHELGHIACGHLQADGFVADEKINAEALDSDENQADAFAIRLLNGRENAQYMHTRYALSAKNLAEAVTSKSKDIGVDAGHIALNYSHGMNRHALGKATLKLLPSQNGAERMINEAMFASIGNDRLSEDQLEILARACQCSIPESLLHF